MGSYRRLRTVLLASAPAVLVPVLLSSCALGAPAPKVTATATVSASASPSPSADAGSGAGGALVVGTCGPDAGSSPIPAIYHVWSGSTKPIEMTVDAFDSDGTSHRVSRTVDGPAATVLSWDDCRSDGTSVPWTLTATQPGADGSTLSCALESYLGTLVEKSFPGEQSGTPTISCTATLNGK